MNLPCEFLLDDDKTWQDGTILDIQLIPAMDCAEGVYIFLISDGYGTLHRIKGRKHVTIKTWCNDNEDTRPA